MVAEALVACALPPQGALALVDIAQERARMAREQRQAVCELQQWSAQKILPASLGMDNTCGVYPAPGFHSLNLDHCDVIPPASRLARRALGDARRNPKSFYKQLRDMWAGRHRGLRHKELPALRSQRPSRRHASLQDSAYATNMICAPSWAVCGRRCGRSWYRSRSHESCTTRRPLSCGSARQI